MIRTNAIANVRQQIHSALRIQHPEWFLPNGDSPICDAYEARLMDLLALVSSPPTSEGILGTASGRCADCAVPMGALIAASWRCMAPHISKRMQRKHIVITVLTNQ